MDVHHSMLLHPLFKTRRKCNNSWAFHREDSTADVLLVLNLGTANEKLRGDCVRP